MPDTIVAVATAPMRSAIGILRLSGGQSIQLVSSLFRPANGFSLIEAENRKLVYGTLYDEEGTILDRCLATISRAPNSYTGEDTAEVQCHGSPLLLSRAMRALLALGARTALPGEFTKRAFLNGRMDLTEAEAVIDLIDAETRAAAQNAAGQLAGAIRKKIDGIYDGLLDLVARFQAILDYPDEEIPDLSQPELEGALEQASADLARLLQSFRQGKILTDGVPTALIGRPNVGKSS
ncbi:MAG: tRNA uridine-5-carboxymethylaminomethyl(34) synthesis GTPase MnmE, partial [Oscillospiraceae bacterium]|nr:tRNA uridine-5-carboxymethylaminomethyl(34) synthesis GTPase MnmE [Oscillospiraceae bacterium]